MATTRRRRSLSVNNSKNEGRQRRSNTEGSPGVDLEMRKFSRDDACLDDVLGRVMAISSYNYNSNMTHTTSISADEDDVEGVGDLPPLHLYNTFPPKDERDSPPMDREGMTRSLPGERVLSLSAAVTLPPASQAVMDKYTDANMYRSKSSPMSHGTMIFDGPLKYKSSTAATYDPAWMRFKETAKILTVYSNDPMKDSIMVMSIGFIDVRNATMKSKQSGKKVHLEIITQAQVSHKFSFESIEEAMKLVEAIDRCIGNCQLSPRSGSEGASEPSPPPLKASTPARSVKFSTPPMPSKSELSVSPTLASKSEPAIPEMKSDTKPWRNRSESTNSTQSEGSKLVQNEGTKLLQKKSSKSLQKHDAEVSFLDYSIYDSHKKKVALRSLSKNSSLAIYVTPEFGDLDAPNPVSDLLKRDGDYLKNRGIKIVIVSTGSPKHHQSVSKEVLCLEDQSGALLRWLCEKSRRAGSEEKTPSSAFLLLDQTKDIIYSASISDKSRPAMDDIVEAVDFFILE